MTHRGGGRGDDYRGTPATLALGEHVELEQIPNAYVRTSMHNPSKQEMPYRDMWPYLERIYDRFGPRRVIYAKSFELLIMKDLIPVSTAEAKEWILGKTVLSVWRFGAILTE